MRFSKLFGKTLRQAPAEAESVSHQLLLRAGMIAQEAGLPAEPTAQMGINKVISDKTRPLEQENKRLKGQLRTPGPQQGGM